MKAGVIANSELCLPLLHYLKQTGAGAVLYFGEYNPVADINAVLSFCSSNSIAVEMEKSPAQLYSWLSLHQPDYCFVFGYKSLIDVGRLGPLRQRLFNIHPGKLPQYRGPNPVFWQLKNGESELGMAIHFLSGKYDTGEIVWSRQIKNEVHFSHGLVDFIFSNMLVEGVQYILNTGIDELQKKKMLQDEGQAATYKRPALQDVLINWQAMPAKSIVNLAAACNPWNKGAITMCNNMEIKIIDAELAEGKTTAPAGTITDTRGALSIACAGGSLVRVHHLNINGIFVPARFADRFGFAAGQMFTSP